MLQTIKPECLSLIIFTTTLANVYIADAPERLSLALTKLKIIARDKRSSLLWL